MRLALLALVAATAAACNPVYSLAPVGEKARDLTADKADWEGTFAHEEGAITVTVIDAAKGRLQIGWFEKKNDRLDPRTVEVELRTAGKQTFANVKDPDKPPRLVFGRIEKKDRQILVYPPHNDAWEALIKAKKLPGTITKKPGDKSTELVLAALGAKELAIVTSDAGGLFEIPLAFLKITK